MDAVQAATSRPPQRAADYETESPPAQESALRLLLVEDVPVNQMVAAGLLELMGHDVTIANNGYEALQAVEGQSFGAIFMDIEMPEMDGFEATKRIRRREALTGSHTPIIAMTAHAVSGFREHCLAAGMDGYIGKPIAPEMIEEVLASLGTCSSDVAEGASVVSAPALASAALQVTTPAFQLGMPRTLKSRLLP